MTEAKCKCHRMKFTTTTALFPPAAPAPGRRRPRGDTATRRGSGGAAEGRGDAAGERGDAASRRGNGAMLPPAATPGIGHDSLPGEHAVTSLARFLSVLKAPKARTASRRCAAGMGAESVQHLGSP